MLYSCCRSIDTASGLSMHSRVISLARAGGLMQLLPVELGSAAAPRDLESSDIFLYWRTVTEIGP